MLYKRFQQTFRIVLPLMPPNVYRIARNFPLFFQNIFRFNHKLHKNNACKHEYKKHKCKHEKIALKENKLSSLNKKQNKILLAVNKDIINIKNKFRISGNDNIYILCTRNEAIAAGVIIKLV